MNFEKNTDPKESMSIGAAKIAVHVENIHYSIYANEYRKLEIHELINLIKLWSMPEWKKVSELFTKSLFPQQIQIKTGQSDHHLSHCRLDLTVLQGEWLKFQDGQVIQVPHF